LRGLVAQGPDEGSLDGNPSNAASALALEQVDEVFRIFPTNERAEVKNPGLFKRTCGFGLSPSWV